MTLSLADAIIELTDPANAAKYSTYDGLIELTKRVSEDKRGRDGYRGQTVKGARVDLIFQPP